LLKPPGLVPAVPLAPNGDGGTIVLIAVVGQVNVEWRPRNEDPVDTVILLIGEDIPCHWIVNGMHWRVVSDVIRADPEIASSANIPEDPLIVVSFEPPLLIITVMAVPSKDRVAVRPRKIKGGTRLAVDEDVSCTFLDSHGMSYEITRAALEWCLYRLHDSRITGS